MPAPQQSSVPVYKETANIPRPNVAYYLHDERKSAGFQLAKLLNVAVDKFGGEYQKNKAELDQQDEATKIAHAQLGLEDLNTAQARGTLDLIHGEFKPNAYDMKQGQLTAASFAGEIRDAYMEEEAYNITDPKEFNAWLRTKVDAKIAEAKAKGNSYYQGFVRELGGNVELLTKQYAGATQEVIANKSAEAFQNKLKLAREADKYTSRTKEFRGWTEKYLGVSPAGAPKGGDKGLWLRDKLVKDLGITKAAAAAFAGNLHIESAGFNTLQEINPVVKGSRGGYGWAQWTGPRRKQFEKWAKEKGLDPSSDEANYGFLIHELTSTPEGAVLKALNGVNDPAKAALIISRQFLRPGIPHESKRIREAQRYFSGQYKAADADGVSKSINAMRKAGLSGWLRGEIDDAEFIKGLAKSSKTSRLFGNPDEAAAGLGQLRALFDKNPELATYVQKQDVKSDKELEKLIGADGPSRDNTDALLSDEAGTGLSNKQMRDELSKSLAKSFLEDPGIDVSEEAVEREIKLSKLNAEQAQAVREAAEERRKLDTVKSRKDTQGGVELTRKAIAEQSPEDWATLKAEFPDFYKHTLDREALTETPEMKARSEEYVRSVKDSASPETDVFARNALKAYLAGELTKDDYIALEQAHQSAKKMSVIKSSPAIKDAIDAARESARRMGAAQGFDRLVDAALEDLLDQNEGRRPPVMTILDTIDAVAQRTTASAAQQREALMNKY